MATFIQFGRLTSTVVPRKGPPFNEYAKVAVPGGVLTPVLTVAIPSGVGLPSFWLATVLVAARINALVEVKRSGTVVCAGYTPVNMLPFLASFPDGEIEGAPGQDFSVEVLHDHTGPVDFHVNLSGFKRQV